LLQNDEILKDIFRLTKRPNKNLFYKKNDPNDLRLGEIVKSSISDYYNSKFVLVGCPQDIGVKRNNGRPGAAKAPEIIRQYFYKLVVNEKFIKTKLFDIGDIKIQESLEKTHLLQEEVITKILLDGKKVIILGGGNDISYPDCKALSSLKKEILALNFDSHFDVRFNKLRNSGTSYFMLLEQNIIKGKNFWEIGIKSSNSSAQHKRYLQNKKVNIIFIEELLNSKIESKIPYILKKNKSKVVFIGFDMDSVKSSDAPGVSAPGSFGFTSEDAIKIACLAGKDNRTKIFEISEVNPRFDIDGRTSRLAALMIWYFISSSIQ
jgi:formiminoglutamase